MSEELKLNHVEFPEIRFIKFDGPDQQDDTHDPSVMDLIREIEELSRSSGSHDTATTGETSK